MYRRYTITGMNKKNLGLSGLLWACLIGTGRTAYFFLSGQQIQDTYGYFAQALIRAGESERVFHSGLAYVYTGVLSGLLKFTGNRIGAVGIYQLVMQVLWLILFFAGITILFGRLAGFVASGIMFFSPWILKTMFIVSPENFCMLLFSFSLLVIGWFYLRTKAPGWYRSLWGRLYLEVTGFFLGVFCVLSYMGWALVVLLAYILTENHFDRKDAIHEQKAHWDELEEKEILMGSGTQACLLFGGLAVGIWAALMGYTGITGLFLWEQFGQWVSWLLDLPQEGCDIHVLWTVWLLCAVMGGVLCHLTIMKAEGRRSIEKAAGGGSGEKGNGSTQEGDGAMGEIGEEGEYIITEDGRRIKLLDNPLPVPPRHIKKEMRFDIDDFKDDFDFEIKAEDDFDIG